MKYVIMGVLAGLLMLSLVFPRQNHGTSEVVVIYDKSIYAIDKEGLLDDLEQAYILENFETNTLVVFDEKNGYTYNKEAIKVGEEMREIYSRMLNKNKVELKTK